MSNDTIGGLMRLYHNAITNLKVMGPKGDMTEEKFIRKFDEIKGAVIAEMNLKEEREFWALPPETPVVGSAERLLSELVFWMSRV